MNEDTIGADNRFCREIPEHPMSPVEITKQLAAANCRIAELEAQIETQGRNCQHYADMTLKLESDLAKAREIIERLDLHIVDNIDGSMSRGLAEALIDAEKWMEGK